eukprot:3698599-Pyramimonas_sp.AAC.2
MSVGTRDYYRIPQTVEQEIRDIRNTLNCYSLSAALALTERYIRATNYDHQHASSVLQHTIFVASNRYNNATP